MFLRISRNSVESFWDFTFVFRDFLKIKTFAGAHAPLPPTPLPEFFLCPPYIVRLGKICFKHIIKTKCSSLKVYFDLPNLKTWLRT